MKNPEDCFVLITTFINKDVGIFEKYPKKKGRAFTHPTPGTNNILKKGYTTFIATGYNSLYT